ncbi:PadR family transcriptional regulator [Acuticoccus kandeliae]|uniref:PadR family transcriptional regulator n=1 Tax=Acuticoccus kandeliae TaxID=2073160 RepID=UPI00196B1A9E|nr:PadR family transcriptional regulator [Acuticoccus kandeliae]
MHDGHRHEGPKGHRHGRDHHGRGRRGKRPFDYGELRLLLLAKLAERPRHGYELIKAIDEQMGGAYTPSPGVIYPTLSWLEDMGYAEVAPAEGDSRKSYVVTEEGRAFLTANRAMADELLTRRAPPGPPADTPEAVLRSMDNLKRALRRHIAETPLPEETVAGIAAAIDAAAAAIDAMDPHPER